MPSLSIFMPTYNAGKFVSKAIESVLNQTFRDFEFVIYDDGSGDNTYDICKKYAEKDARIHLIKGVHGTGFMNQFLQEANGFYIGFIDHDDYLDENYFQCMMQHLMTTDADCAISSYTLVDSNYQVLPWYTPTLKDGEIIDSKEAHRRFLTSLDIEGFRWNKIYKRSIISAHDFRFPRIKASPNDIPGEFELLSYINTAVLVGNKGYYYRQSSTSLVASGNTNFVMGFLSVYKNIGEKAISEGLENEGRYYITWRTVNTLFNAFKERKTYRAEEWKCFRTENGPKKRLYMSLPETMHILNQYDNKRDSRVKFLIKTMIVYLVYH